MCLNLLESLNCDFLAYGECDNCETECIVKANKRCPVDLIEDLTNQENDLTELSEHFDDLIAIVENPSLGPSKADQVSDLKEMISGLLEELEDFRKVMLINLILVLEDKSSSVNDVTE